MTAVPAQTWTGTAVLSGVAGRVQAAGKKPHHGPEIADYLTQVS